jgi:hypothetical protein
VNITGSNYRVFLLDINQKASSPLLSLDQLQIFVGASGNLTGYSSRALAGLPAIFDLNPDGSNTNWVELNGRLNQGLGKSDLALLVPDSLLATAASNLGAASPDVYIFSRFGDHFATNGGFEQWGVQQQAALSSLSGYVYFDAANIGAFQAGEGISGVMMTLSGYDSNNHFVTLNAVTDANGFYFFDGLLAGKYTITKTPPPILHRRGRDRRHPGRDAGSRSDQQHPPGLRGQRLPLRLWRGAARQLGSVWRLVLSPGGAAVVRALFRSV